MSYILTLVTNPSVQILNEVIINKAFQQLEKADAEIENLSWLKANEACDISFSCEDINLVKSKLKFSKYPVDYAISKAETRKKKLFISDMDSTIINQECIDEIADLLGLKEQVSKITEKAMNNELDFKSALRERVALLKDLPEDSLNKVYKDKITFSPYALELITALKKHDIYCVLVSGGFTFFTDKVAKELGFHENHANRLEIKDGKLTGLVVEPILDKEAKLLSLTSIAKKLGISSSEVVAIGDGANDIPMLKKAGLGIAYYAKPVVQMEVNAWISHTSLKSVLYFLGISD